MNLSTNHAKLNIDASFSDRLVDLIDEGYDLAVRIGSLPDSSTLASRRIGVQTMSVCAAPSYLEKHGLPNTLNELSRHRGIAYSRSGSQTPWRLQGDDGRMHEVAIKTRLRLDDLQAVMDAAVAGHGLAWLPCWLVSRYLPGGELQVVFAGSQVATRDSCCLATDPFPSSEDPCCHRRTGGRGSGTRGITDARTMFLAGRRFGPG